MPGEVQELERRIRDLEQARAADAARDAMVEKALQQLYPLVELYGRFDERLGDVRGDVREAHDAIRELRAMLEREREDRRAGQEERKRELEAAVAERDKQHAELKAGNRRAVLAFMGVFFTALAGVIIQLISQGNHP